MLGEVCHFVDTLAALADAPPVAVEQMTPHGVDDSIVAILRFADGSVGTILYSSIGDPAVPKERIEIYANGLVIEIEDFASMTISRNGRRSRRKTAQDKGQTALMRRFLEGRASGTPPISIETLEAVSAATLALAQA